MRKHDRINKIKGEMPSLLKKKEELEEAYDKKWDTAPAGLDFKQFQEYFKPETTELGEISRKIRLVQEYKLDEIPDYGDVMSLEDFKACVESGGFIDSDGFGKYARDGKESDIEIRPSDIRYDMVRTDFDLVVWYNK